MNDTKIEPWTEADTDRAEQDVDAYGAIMSPEGYRIIAEVKRQAAEIERLAAELAGQSKAAIDWREAAERHALEKLVDATERPPADASLDARAKIAMLAHDASPPAVFGGPWENAAPECHAAWIAVVRAVDASRPGLTEEEVRPRSRPYIAEQRQRERSQVYVDFEKMGQLESDVIEWLSANYEPLKRRALEASRASRGTPAPGHVSIPRGVLEKLVDATQYEDDVREARDVARRVLHQDFLRHEPARTDPEAARQLADARAEHDQLDAKFRSYDGGDRPQSPPVSLIRDLRAAEERVRELEAK